MRRDGLIHGAGSAQRLLESARRLFATRGPDGVRVQELLDAANVTRPVLYYYYGCKEGLFLAADRSLSAEYETALWRAARSDRPVAERIRGVCGVHAAALRGRARAVAVVEALVFEGIANGVFDVCDPREAAFALVGAAEVGAALGEGRKELKRDALEPVLAVVFRALYPRSETCQGPTVMTRRTGAVWTPAGGTPRHS
jgi:AcrR family transcriptional regulator